MGTIEIHEPEVNEVKPASRPNAGVPPKKDVAQAFAPRVMFSDSLLDFGQARKRKAFATTTSFIFNCVAIGLMLAVPLMFTDELPKAQLLTFSDGASPASPASSPGSGAGGKDRPSDPDGHAFDWRIAHADQDSTQDRNDQGRRSTAADGSRRRRSRRRTGRHPGRADGRSDRQRDQRGELSSLRSKIRSGSARSAFASRRA